MARIRSVKPEYPKHHKTRSVSRDARLLNIHLWNLADDDGRLRELPQWILGEIFPTDEDVTPVILRGWLEELAEARLIVRYEVDGERYIQCHDWNDHQKISHPTRSVLPPFDAGFSTLRSGSGAAPEPLAPEGKGREEEGKGDNSAHASERDKAILAILDDLSFRRNIEQPAVPAAVEVNERFGSLASEAEAEKLRHYYTEGPGKRKPLTDVVWAWRQWLERVRPDEVARRPKPTKDHSAYSKVEAAT